MEAQDERGWVSGLGRGEVAAFDAIYSAYRPRLFAFLARLGGRRELAEDLLQETWVRLARHARSLPPDTRLGPWLFTVARNLFVSHRRRVALQGDRLRALAAGVREEGGPGPFEATAATELERRLEAALAALSVADREVLLLVGVEGLEPAEAAEILGVRADALRQRLKRARNRLAERLGPEALEVAR